MALGGNVTVNTNKSPTRTAVASLITGCCVGTATGIEDIDNGGVGDGSSYATPMPMEGILEEEEQRGDHHHHGFYAAASQQQQRNRFTSSPLIERDSSLIKEQSGLLSLLASGTFTETTSPREITNATATSNGNGNNNPHSLRRNTTPPTPSMTMMQTPPRSASRRKKHHLQQSSQYSPNNNNNNNNNCPPSPAMELSMARQSANATNQLLMSASSPRISRRHRLGSSDSRSVNSASTRSHASNSIMGSPKVKKQLAAMTIESPTKKARQENNVHGNHNNNNSNSNSIVMPNLDIDEGYSAENTVAPSPTAAAAVTTSTKETTTMARSTIIPQTSSFSSTEIINGSQHKQNIVIWKHYTKSQLDTCNDDHLHHLELWTTTTTTNTNNTTTTTNVAKEDKKKLNEELINTYKFPRVYLQNPKFVEYNHLKTLWWYKLQCGAESTLGHVYGNGNGAEVLFDPSVQPINVWSEPSSTTMKVRGVTYAQDGVKVPSEESMFAVLGVDNFVNEKGSGSGSGDGGMKKSGTDSFMERWKNVCEEVGLESVPFL
jgi:hypothetical protein